MPSDIFEALTQLLRKDWTFCLEPTGLWCLKLALTTPPILVFHSVVTEPNKMAAAYAGVGQNHLFHILQISGWEMEERDRWQVSMWWPNWRDYFAALLDHLSFLSECC
jgi:hypothetical protein